MITVLGSVNIDMIARVPHLPHAGETILATDFRRAPGGKGANQAVAAARAGADVVFAGCIGDDENGSVARAGLSSEGINLDFLKVVQSASTGLAMIAVDASGENCIVVSPGANSYVSTSDVANLGDNVAQSDILLMQLEIPLEAVIDAAQRAHAAGTTVMLNPAPAQDVERPLLQLVDILVANRNEIGLLSGMGSPVDPASAARYLLDFGIGTVIVTLGEAGAVIVIPQGEIAVPPFSVQAVDSTGAGDAFVGNLASALISRQPLEDAVRFASAAAALSVQIEGAQPSMPDLQQTQTFLRGASGP